MLIRLMRFCMGAACLFVVASHAEMKQSLALATLEQAVLGNDAGLRALRANTGAASKRAEAADKLPDPSLNLAAQNFPLDTLDIAQEPMTQLSLGLMQRFPNADKRKLREQIARTEATRGEAEQALERLKLLREARGDWLRVYAARQRLVLLRERQQLYRQLMQTAESAYATNQAGRSAPLEAKLKLAELKQQAAALAGEESAARQALKQWLGDADGLDWPNDLPDTLTRMPSVLAADHPELEVIDTRRRKAGLEVKLANADYKSDWALEARYGYREDRVDFVSLGVTVDLPVLSHSRLAPNLAAAELDSQAADASRADRQAELESQWASTSARVQSLAAQSKVYKQDILPEYAEQVALARIGMESGSGGLGAMLDRKLKQNQARRQWLDTRVALAEKIIELAYLSGKEKP